MGEILVKKDEDHLQVTRNLTALYSTSFIIPVLYFYESAL